MILATHLSTSATQHAAHDLVHRAFRDVRRADAVTVGSPDPAWDAFLDKLVERRRLDLCHAAEVRSIWHLLGRVLGPGVPLPLTQKTAEGALQLAWKRQRHYLEIDVFEDGQVAWFYRDSESGDYDGADPVPVGELAVQFWPRLRLAAGAA